MRVVPSIYEEFFERLKASRERVLLLDYDGTLAPFQINRDLAFPYPEIPQLVRKIMDAGTRVVLITGRPAQELVLLSGIHPHPEIWGTHGWERLSPDGSYEFLKLAENQSSALQEAARVLNAEGIMGRIEAKPAAVAVHWRGLSQSIADQIREKALSVWAPVVQRSSLHITEFDGGLEIRPLGRDKGNAVNDILSECSSTAVVAYLGDDQTDEDAFRALKGRGLTVLVRAESRPTTADLWLKPPQELTKFLKDWLSAPGGRHDDDPRTSD